MPTQNLGTGTASTTTFLRGDQSYQTPPSFPFRAIPNASGDIWLSLLCTASTSTLALVANRLYFIPIAVGRKNSITTAGIPFVSGTGDVRCGLYRSDGVDFNPGTLVADFGVVVTAANTTVATTPVAAIDLEPGLYYFAFVSNSTPTIRAAAAANVISILGALSTGGTVSGINHLFRSFTYGALPADETASYPLTINSGVTPMGLIQ